MYCPQCGSTQADDLNFCKLCGANLQAVRGALVKGFAPDDKLDWKKTWLAEMVMTNAEKDRRRGITPELKRRREIKAGVITASAGLSLAVVLSVLMEAIVINGQISALAADILSRVWIVGLIPILVGFALIFNGTVISKSTAETEQESGRSPRELQSNVSIDEPFSVTDSTTRHLEKVRSKTKNS